MQLRKRSGVWHVRYFDHAANKRVERSTRTADRRAAEALGRQWERDAADPDHATTTRATLADALTLLVTEAQAAATARPPRGSLATVEFYRSKAGHWLRIVGGDTPLRAITSATVQRYIKQRRTEPAHAARIGESDDSERIPRVSDHSISKELVTLRKALKLARMHGLYRGDPSAVLPVAFAPKYRPRRRWLQPDELTALLRNLEPDQSARCAWMVATSGEWIASERALRSDVQSTPPRVLVRGSKRETRLRTVPLLLEWQRDLIDFALKHSAGDATMFAPWTSPQQSIRWACKRAGIERCSPNDLRRTFAQWCRRDGLTLELVAPLMGHGSTKMLQEVYGVMDVVTIEHRAQQILCPTGAPSIAKQPVDPGDSEGGTRGANAPNPSSETVETAVGRVGIEPTTNGLKVLCYLTPKGSNLSEKRGRRAGLAPPVPRVLRRVR